MDGKEIVALHSEEGWTLDYLADMIDAALAQVRADCATLEAERDEMMRLYVLEHERHTATIGRVDELSVERDKYTDLEARWKEREASYRKWGVLPCPTCQDANARIADLEATIAKRANVRVSCHDVWLRERARREKAEHERDEALKHGLALALQVDELEHSLDLAEQGHANAH